MRYLYITVLDAERLVEPAFALEDANQPQQDIHRLLFGTIAQRWIFRFHVAPNDKSHRNIN